MNAPAWVAHGPVPGLMAALIALTLLWVFHQVVQGAVTQGDLRRAIAAQAHSATWQCKELRGLQERSDCLALIPQATPAVAWPGVDRM